MRSRILPIQGFAIGLRNNFLPRVKTMNKLVKIARRLFKDFPMERPLELIGPSPRLDAVQGQEAAKINLARPPAECLARADDLNQVGQQIAI